MANSIFYPLALKNAVAIRASALRLGLHFLAAAFGPRSELSGQKRQLDFEPPPNPHALPAWWPLGSDSLSVEECERLERLWQDRQIEQSGSVRNPPVGQESRNPATCFEVEANPLS